jgi:hypothetical protein
MVTRISRKPLPLQAIIDHKQLENVKYFNYFGSMIKNDARYTRKIKFRTTTEKLSFNRKKNLFTSKLDLNLRKKSVKCYIWSLALQGATSWTLRKVDQNYVENF